MKELWKREGYKKHMSEAHRGNPGGMLGKKHTAKTKEKISRSKKGTQAGKKHPNWKGGKICYLRKKARQTAKENGFNIQGKVVHHKDRNLKNYHISNLKIMTLSEHSKFHYSEKMNKLTKRFKKCHIKEYLKL